jgi:hypothetical protein
MRPFHRVLVSRGGGGAIRRGYDTARRSREVQGDDLYFDLLVADLAVVLDVAKARDVATALARHWARSRAIESSFSRELRDVAGLAVEDLVRLEA